MYFFYAKQLQHASSSSSSSSSSPGGRNVIVGFSAVLTSCSDAMIDGKSFRSDGDVCQHDETI